jgi:hypothetical protein
MEPRSILRLRYDRLSERLHERLTPRAGENFSPRRHRGTKVRTPSASCLRAFVVKLRLVLVLFNRSRSRRN